MKKILITRRLIRESEDKASKLFEAKFNSNDELYSQSKIIEMSEGCDGILSSLTEKLDADTINKLPEDIKIISNFAVGFGNIDLDAAKKKRPSMDADLPFFLLNSRSSARSHSVPKKIHLPRSIQPEQGRSLCLKNTANMSRNVPPKVSCLNHSALTRLLAS